MFERPALRVLMVLSLAASVADAQLVNGKWQAPAKGSGAAGAAAPRQGVQANPQPAVVTTQQSNNAVVPIRVIHAVLMSDGSVMADFGAGLEPVQRSCGGNFQHMPLRIIGSLPPAPGMQPAPAQLTESQKALPSAQVRAAANQAARASCHLRDAHGRVFATR